MHRLFVAIRPPESVRARLLDLMEGVRGARWRDEDHLHLTLRFIGEVERPVAEDVAAVLGNVRHPGFALALAGLGTFSRRGSPATLWAGMAPASPLHALRKKIDVACARAGLAPDRRAYAPHIAVARLDGTAEGLGGLLARPLAGPPFAVEEFRLYESRLGRNGALYSVVQRYFLG